MTEEDVEILSDREQEILKLVATGASNKEIAYQLSISPNTVKVHLRNIFTKINAVSRTEAAMYAVQTGLVTTNSQVQNSTDDTTHISTNPFVGWIRRHRLVITIFLLILICAVFIYQIFLNIPVTDSAQFLTPTLESRWQHLTNMSTARAGLTAVYYSNAIYTFSGESSSGIVGTSEKYDITSSTWIKLPDKPHPVKDAGAVIVDGKVMIFGGTTESNQPTDIVEVFDPITNKWLSSPPLPTPLSDFGITTYEGRIFIFGGWEGAKATKSVSVYNPILEEWDILPDLTIPLMSLGVAIIDSEAYLISGWDGDKTYSEIIIYSLLSNLEGVITRPEVEIKLPTRKYGAEVISVLENIFVLGGNSRFPLSQDDPFGLQYSKVSDSWGEIANFPYKNFSNFALAHGNANMFIVGGKIGAKVQSTIYSFKAFNVVFIPIVE